MLKINNYSDLLNLVFYAYEKDKVMTTAFVTQATAQGTVKCVDK